MVSEHELYKLVASYIQMQYPEAVYRFDLAADLKLTFYQAKTHKSLHPKRGYKAEFGVGFDEICQIIDNYMRGEI